MLSRMEQAQTQAVILNSFRISRDRILQEYQASLIFTASGNAPNVIYVQYHILFERVEDVLKKHDALRA